MSLGAHPLYTFLKDTQPGQTNGQAVEGAWWDVVVKAAPASAAKASRVVAMRFRFVMIYLLHSIVWTRAGMRPHIQSRGVSPRFVPKARIIGASLRPG